MSDAGGMMTLTDAYVRINRARGLELISPEDLLDACQSLDSFENSSLSTCSSHVFTNSEFSMCNCRGVFSTGAMGALAPAIFGHFSTVGKNYGC